jgi:hypothetical protein
MELREMAGEELSRLAEDEKAALVALLKRTIDADRFPLSPPISQLRGILAKLAAPKPALAPLSLLRLFAPPRHPVVLRRLQW